MLVPGLLLAQTPCAAAQGAQGAQAAMSVRILDLPFKASALRGPGSEVALAVATSGLIPLARPRPATPNPASVDPKAAREPDPAPIAVVWGEGRGAVLALEDGAVRATLVGAEAIEGLALAETPRPALPGSHRAVSGGLSAFLSGPVRGSGGAAGLTVRERQPMGVTADPKPVPVTTETVAPGPDPAFALRRPRIAAIDGRPAIVAVTMGPDGASALALLGKTGEGRWTVSHRSPPQAGSGPQGASLALAAVADFSGKGRPEGRPQIAAVRAPDGAGTLQLWTVAEDGVRLVSEAPGYTAVAPDGAELAAPVETESGHDLALPSADRNAITLVSLQDGLHEGIRERARTALPAPAALGVAVLGRGAKARILVGLSDGRVAVAEPAP